MFLQPSGCGTRYKGRNETFRELQGEARVTWGYGAPEMVLQEAALKRSWISNDRSPDSQRITQQRSETMGAGHLRPFAKMQSNTRFAAVGNRITRLSPWA
jgi:hypothetical protein